MRDFTRLAVGAGFALVLAACGWSSDAPLMPESVADPAPVALGAYPAVDNHEQAIGFTDGGRTGLYRERVGVVHRYQVRFDQVTPGYFLVQAVYEPREGLSADSIPSPQYVLMRPATGGFDMFFLDCSEPAAQQAAVNAGAENFGDSNCVFHSYESLLQAARAAAASAGNLIVHQYRRP